VWRLARADRIEAELFEERRSAQGGLGLALIRDGNGARSFETLLRYRGAAMAEFWRALRTLKALQAEQAFEDGTALAHPIPPAPRPPLADRSRPNEPECGADPLLDYLPSEPSAGALHEAVVAWMPNEPEPGSTRDLTPSHTQPAPAEKRERCPRSRPGGANEPEADADRGRNES
jgi:hypothetical protein